MFGSQKSGFGSAGFGSSSTFGGSSGGSLFGSNTQTSQSNSLFGNTANNTNNTGGGSMFGNNTGNNSGGFSFGNNQTQNNQQNNQQQQSNTGGLFGNTTSASTGGLFGGGNASNFGSSGSTFGANTGGTNLFGNNTNQTNTSNTSTGLFGNNQAANTFGGNNQTQFSAGFSGNGTEHKFEPKLSKDSNPKGGTDINTRLLCYSGMNNYTAKSLEELRIEDYVAARNGPKAWSNSSFGNTGTTGGIFGTTIYSIERKEDEKFQTPTLRKSSRKRFAPKILQYTKSGQVS